MFYILKNLLEMSALFGFETKASFTEPRISANGWRINEAHEVGLGEPKVNRLSVVQRSVRAKSKGF